MKAETEQQKGINNMSGPVWFDADKDTCENIEALHEKKIAARVSLPNGWVIEGIGDLWPYVNGKRDKAAVTVVFECMTQPYAFTQTRIHLTSDQASMIKPSSGSGTDYEYPGDLKPALIPVEKKE